MTVAAINDQLRRLGSLKFPPADFQGFYDVLTECDTDDLQEAVTRIQRVRVEWPAPSELLAEARSVRGERLAASVVAEQAQAVPLAEPVTIHVPQAGRDFTITHEHQYHCSQCQDSGHEEFACDAATAQRYPWMVQRPCDRPQPHGGHSWVRYCLCFKSNPVVQARIASGRR